MSKARAKGTAGENYFLLTLRHLFGETLVERAPLKGVDDYGDYTGVPWLHEAKNTKKPLFLKWARVCEEKVRRRWPKGGWDWVILWKGDLRKGEGPYVLMPLQKYEQLAESYMADIRDVRRDPDRALYAAVWAENTDDEGYVIEELS